MRIFGIVLLYLGLLILSAIVLYYSFMFLTEFGFLILGTIFSALGLYFIAISD